MTKVVNAVKNALGFIGDPLYRPWAKYHKI